MSRAAKDYHNNNITNAAANTMINNYPREKHFGTFTGDASYSWLADELQRAQQSSESLAVLCIGIEPNASTMLGPGLWEAALQQALLRIRTTIRIRDRIFTRKDNEIIVILPHTNSEGAITLINRLIRRLTEQPMMNVPDMSITAHIGGVVSSSNSDAETLLQLAQSRLHAARKLQRRFIFADEPQQTPALSTAPVDPEIAFVHDIARWMQAHGQSLQHQGSTDHTQTHLQEIDARWEDIQRALMAIVTRHMVDIGLQMVWPITQYCLLRNRIADGLQFAEGITGIAGLSTAYAYIQAMIALGELLTRANDLATAADRLHTAFTLATLPHIQYLDLAAWALSDMALMYLQQQQRDLALSYAQKAQELALNSGKPQVIVLARQRLLQIQTSPLPTA